MYIYVNTVVLFLDHWLNIIRGKHDTFAHDNSNLGDRALRCRYYRGH